MGRYSGGWVKSPRAVYDEEGELAQYPAARDILAILRAWARFGDTDPNGLSRGQVLVSQDSFKAMGHTRQTTRTALARLQKIGKINQAPNQAVNQAVNQARTGRGTIVTVLDYDDFEGSEDDIGQPPNQAPNQAFNQAFNQALTRPQPRKEKGKKDGEGKKSRKENLSPPPPESGGLRVVPPPYLPSDRAVAEDWLAFALEQMPWGAKNASWNVEAFAAAIGKCRQTLGMLDTGMAEVLGYIRTDDFWRKVAVSPAGLLERRGKSGLRKIDNILLRIRESEQPKGKLAEMDAALAAWAKGE